MNILFPAIVVGVMVLVGGIIYGSYLAEKKRVEALQRLTSELGFDFLPQGDAALLQSLSTFQLFSQGRSKRLWNLLRGTTDDLVVSIFDYCYVTGGGKHKHTWNQTVIGFQFDGAALPTFALRPENFADKIGSWMGFQDIDFESHPSFSKRYLLRGSDEAAVRTLFSATVLDFYDDKPGLSTEGSGNVLLFYRHRRRVRPEEIRAFMEEGFGVLTQFRSTG